MHPYIRGGSFIKADGNPKSNEVCSEGTDFITFSADGGLTVNSGDRTSTDSFKLCSNSGDFKIGSGTVFCESTFCFSLGVLTGLGVIGYFLGLPTFPFGFFFFVQNSR